MNRKHSGIRLWTVSAAWIAGLAFFVGLIAFYGLGGVCLHQATASTEPSPELQDELKAWAQLWNRLDAVGVDALNPDLRIPGALYAGDTCGMRYPDLYRVVDAESRERLIIAAFGNDPETKRELLRSLLHDSVEDIRARAAIEMARVALREGDLDEATSALRGVEGLQLKPACEADRHYVEGRIAVSRGDVAAALKAFAATNALDPGHWNAYRDRLPPLISALHDTGQDAAACLRHARSLIETLGLLPQLAEDSAQFAKLGHLLDRSGVGSSAAMLASGVTWRWAGQEAYSREVLARGLEAPELLPAVCEREMRNRLVSELRQP